MTFSLHFIPPLFLLLRSFAQNTIDLSLVSFAAVFSAVHQHQPRMRAVFALTYKADNLWLDAVVLHCKDNLRQLVRTLADAQFAVVAQKAVCRRRNIIIG